MDEVRVPFDLDGYERRVREASRRGECFICSVVLGHRDDRCVVARDEISIAFLAKFPTLRGYCLVAPIEHRTSVVDDFSRVRCELEPQRAST